MKEPREVENYKCNLCLQKKTRRPLDGARFRFSINCRFQFTYVAAGKKKTLEIRGNKVININASFDRKRYILRNRALSKSNGHLNECFDRVRERMSDTLKFGAFFD